MIVQTSWLGKRNFIAKCPSGKNVKMDATENYGGDGKGLTPMELILAGVSGCIGIDVTMLLGNNLKKISKIDIQTEGLRREEMPTSFNSIKITFLVEGEIDAERFWKAIRLGHEKYCAVTDSLKSDVTFNLKLNGIDFLENSL